MGRQGNSEVVEAGLSRCSGVSTGGESNESESLPIFVVLIGLLCSILVVKLDEIVATTTSRLART